MLATCKLLITLGTRNKVALIKENGIMRNTTPFSTCSATTSFLAVAEIISMLLSLRKSYSVCSC